MHFIQMTLMRQQSSHKVKNVPLIICIFLKFLPCAALAQSATPKTTDQLVSEIYVTTDATKKADLLSQLSNRKPSSAKDAELFLSVSRTYSDKSIKESALKALSKVTPADKEKISAAYVKALDDKDWQIRGTVITALGKMKAVEAAPKLRSILMEKPRKDELKMMATADDKQQKRMWATYSSPALAARVLGEFKDEESIPLLVSKYAELQETATEALAEMGGKSIPSLLELAKKEKSDRERPAVIALGQISDKSAKSELLTILKTEKDRELRGSVLTSLMNPIYGEDVLDTIKDLYHKEKDTVFILSINNKSGIPFLIDVLRNDTNPRARQWAAVILGNIGDISAVPALEEALKDKSRNVRELSADSLKKIAGHKYN